MKQKETGSKKHVCNRGMATVQGKDIRKKGRNSETISNIPPDKSGDPSAMLSAVGTHAAPLLIRQAATEKASVFYISGRIGKSHIPEYDCNTRSKRKSKWRPNLFRRHSCASRHHAPFPVRNKTADEDSFASSAVQCCLSEMDQSVMVSCSAVGSAGKGA